MEENIRDLNEMEHEKLMKMELEDERDKYHSAHCKSRIDKLRNYIVTRKDNNNMNENSRRGSVYNRPFCAEVVIININEFCNLINNTNLIHKKNSLLAYGFQIPQNKNSNLLHDVLVTLKNIRKEISKKNLQNEELLKLYNNFELLNKFLTNLIETLNNLTNSEIQLEIIWIINNLIYIDYNTKYMKLNYEIIINNVINFLSKLHLQQKDKGILQTMDEKIFRLLGAILNINNNTIELFINNKILQLLVESLNSPVCSLRVSCLWLLNKIITLPNKNKKLYDELECLSNQNAISQYKFIINRFETQKNEDEMAELFWLLNELTKRNKNILALVFNYQKANEYILNNKINNTNVNNIFSDYNTNNCFFDIILSNALSQKLIYPSIRLMNNILITIENENLRNYCINSLLNRNDIKNFLIKILNTERNNIDFYLLQDVLLLIDNLILISPYATIPHFKSNIILLLKDPSYRNENNVLKMCILIYFKMVIANKYQFDKEDSNFIPAFLEIIPKFESELHMIIMILFILYYYLKNYCKIILPDNLENFMTNLDNNSYSFEVYKNALESLYYTTRDIFKH